MPKKESGQNLSGQKIVNSTVKWNSCRFWTYYQSVGSHPFHLWIPQRTTSDELSCISAKSNFPERYAREINFKMKHPCSNQASKCFSKDGNCPKNILDISRVILALKFIQIALSKCFKIYTEHNSLYWCRKLWLLIFLPEEWKNSIYVKRPKQLYTLHHHWKTFIIKL